MGYCMEMQGCNFHIPATSFEEALSAIKSLMTDTSNMAGSCFGGGVEMGRWYAWVHTESVLQSQTLMEALEAWRWMPFINNDGDIDFISFRGEKMGQDEVLFQALAPYVTSGSYIAMRGEDGVLWRWYFQNGSCLEQEGRVVYL
jgi:hypothetical protein